VSVVVYLLYKVAIYIVLLKTRTGPVRGLLQQRVASVCVCVCVRERERERESERERERERENTHIYTFIYICIYI
jgi:hypothetical protein